MQDEQVAAILREAGKLYAANPAHGWPGYGADGAGPHCAITALAAAEMRLDLPADPTAEAVLAKAAGIHLHDLILWEEYSSTEEVVAAFERAAQSLLAQ